MSNKLLMLLLFSITILFTGCSIKRTKYDLIIKKEDVNLIKNYKTNRYTGETDWKVR